MNGRVTPKLGEWLQQIPGMRCPKKHSPRNSKDTALDTQVPKPLVEEPRLKDKGIFGNSSRNTFV